jgi:hypothetical protein
MLRELAFELLPVVFAGVPLAVALLVWSWLRLRRLSLPRRAALVGLRALVMLVLLVLLARPVIFESEDLRSRRTVIVMLDRSQSMALQEEGRSRFERAAAFGRDSLLPALDRQGFKTEALLFADGTASAAAPQWTSFAPDGRSTDLAGAIAQAVRSVQPPPLAVVALTDGIANESAGNRAALAALAEAGTPFLAVGFGRDAGVASLSLQQALAPPLVAPRQKFQVAAQLQASGGSDTPAFDLLLLRDGRMAERRRIPAGAGPRFWSESFSVSEEQEGVHEYALELVMPPRPDLICVNTRSSAHVRVSKEKEFRVLFVQGTLTWDFKFIGRALRADPGIRVTGLSRTSQQSVFRQNVESAGELLNGFPDTLDQVAPYRVLVLSDLKPADLTPPQQDVIARFCGDLGGGVLLIGGSNTFDASWQASRLEGLLPVQFDSSPGVVGLDRPFHLKLNDEALRNPVFQVTDKGASPDVWKALPTFSQYGRVLTAKPAATVWATHDSDLGPKGPRILMAAQPYGAGLSAVIALQNFWRWRLAKDSDPRQFDRFWQQLLRYLGQAGRQDVAIEFPDQELRPGAEVRAVLERQPRPEAAGPARFGVRVVGPDKKPVLEQALDLEPLRPASITFRPPREGTYTVVVRNAQDVQVASRVLELRDVNRELQRTGRDMENLRQWASVTQGLALPAEECPGGEALVARLKERIAAARTERRLRRTLGVDGRVLSLLLACLCGEWLLRRRFSLV